MSTSEPPEPTPQRREHVSPWPGRTCVRVSGGIPCGRRPRRRRRLRHQVYPRIPTSRSQRARPSDGRRFGRRHRLRLRLWWWLVPRLQRSNEQFEATEIRLLVLLRGEVRMRGWRAVRRLRCIRLVWGVGIGVKARCEGQVRRTVGAGRLPTHGAEAGQTPRTVVAGGGGDCERVRLTHKELWGVLQ